MANQMLGLLSGYLLARELGIDQLEHSALPEWGIASTKRLGSRAIFRPKLRLSGHMLDFTKLRELLKRKPSLLIESQVIGMRYSYVRAVAREALALFPPPSDIDSRADLVRDRVLCHVRTGDVWDESSTSSMLHPDYSQPRLAFYQALVRVTGRELAFVGAGLQGSALGNVLGKAFPNAVILPSSQAREDFQLLRQFPRVGLSVSSFSWLACALGTPGQEVHMPILGILDPVRRPDIEAHIPDAISYEFEGGASGRSVEALKSQIPSLGSLVITQRNANNWVIRSETQTLGSQGASGKEE